MPVSECSATPVTGLAILPRNPPAAQPHAQRCADPSTGSKRIAAMNPGADRHLLAQPARWAPAGSQCRLLRKLPGEVSAPLQLDALRRHSAERVACYKTNIASDS